MNDFVEKYGKENIPSVKKIVMPIIHEHVDCVTRNMGIEQERLDRLIDPYLHRPLLGVVFEKNPHGVVLIDGNHRIIKLNSLGEKSYEMFVFHWVLWRQFQLFPKLADDWKNKRSGLIELEQRIQS